MRDQGLEPHRGLEVEMMTHTVRWRVAVQYNSRPDHIEAHGRIIHDRAGVGAVSDGKTDPLLLELVHRVDEVFILLCRIRFSAIAVIRNRKMRKHALGDDMRQGARFFYFFYRIIISREFLTHKADTAHTGIELDMRFDFYAELLAPMRQLLGVVEAVHRLRDILSAQITTAVRGRIAEDEDRFIDLSSAQLQRLIQIGHREEIDPQLVVELADLHSTVTVAVRLDDTAELDALADHAADRLIVFPDRIHIDLRPQPAGKYQIVFQKCHSLRSIYIFIIIQIMIIYNI